MLRKLKKLLKIKPTIKEDILDKIDDLIKEGLLVQECYHKTERGEVLLFYLIGKLKKAIYCCFKEREELVSNDMTKIIRMCHLYINEKRIDASEKDIKKIFNYLKKIYKKQNND